MSVEAIATAYQTLIGIRLTADPDEFDEALAELVNLYAVAAMGPNAIRHRRKPPEERAAIVSEYRELLASGEDKRGKVKALCRRSGVAVQTLHNWANGRPSR